PADIVMLFNGQDKRTALRSREVNHSNVFVRVGNAMNVEKAGRNESTRAWLTDRRSVADEVHVQTAFFFGFAQGRGLRFFVEFNMSAEWQPFAKLPVMNQQHFRAVNDKNGDGEIDCVMNVGHNCRSRSGPQWILGSENESIGK